MEEYYKIFNQYVKSYDFKNPMIRLKFHHTYRVMEFCKEIAESLELNEKDIKIAMLCGLLHDIARFDQWTKYNTFIDAKSFDHGDEGYNILLKNNFIKEFIKDKEIINIVLSTVKNHNKYLIESNLDERTTLFCKIVRDADKLDVIRELGNHIKEDEIIYNEEIIKEMYEEKMCKNNLIKTSADDILRMISWVFDYNFKYSYNFLLKENIIKKKFELLEINGEIEEISKLKEYIFKEIEKRC